MFFRIKPSGPRRYLQIVENVRDGAKTKQSVLCTLGRVDELEASGKLDVLLRSGARHCETAMLVSGLREGTLEAVTTDRRARLHGAVGAGDLCDGAAPADGLGFGPGV